MKYNWTDIQAYYDEGHSWREVASHFGMASETLRRARIRGDFVTSRDASEAQKLARKKNPRKHTKATKKKLREHMLRRLKDGTYPTLGRNFQGRPKSYPEKWWQSVIDARFDNTDYEDEYKFGIYSLDYAWPDLKRCIEVDGSQHEEQQQKASDKRKDAYLLKEGWQVLRMPWKETVADKEAAILKAKEFIGE